MEKNMNDFSNSMKKLVKELDKGNNFIDYFCVMGLSNSVLFDDFLYENDLPTLNASNKIQPEILSKFPPFEKTTLSISEEMVKVIYNIKLALFSKRL